MSCSCDFSCSRSCELTCYCERAQWGWAAPVLVGASTSRSEFCQNPPVFVLFRIRFRRAEKACAGCGAATAFGFVFEPFWFWHLSRLAATFASGMQTFLMCVGVCERRVWLCARFCRPVQFPTKDAIAEVPVVAVCRGPNLLRLATL